MTYVVPLDEARRLYPEYTFVDALTPSAQKAAFHVRNDDGDDLCLKLISPTSDVDRVNREIETLQEISHPNVVKVLEYTYSTRPTGRRHHVIEEFVEGRDLTDVLAKGPLDLDGAKDLFLPLLAGLDSFSRRSIVHRDLKPENVRVRADGSPVIIDFGLVRRLKDPDLTETKHGAAIGTPAYFAPEQFRGDKRDIDPRTDLFAVGVMLYQATVGYHPFYRPGSIYAELEAQVCESEAAFSETGFTSLPPHWQLLIRKLLAKERVNRLGSASQAHAFLSQLTRENQ